MQNTKTTVWANGLIWFGAAVSIAEIMTGTLIAPLGFSKGLLAILTGHLIGCILLYFIGLIGAKSEKSSMETVKLSFGEKGSLIFSTLNILQLVGWTAVMILGGSVAANALVNFGGSWIWSLIIGCMIAIWVFVGINNLGRLNSVAMVGLFFLTIVLSTVIFKGNGNFIPSEAITFGEAVELSVAMPLSWMPLISDYTRTAKEPKKATAVSAIVYFATSSWMYTIGMGATIFTGESDIAKIMTSAGLGIAALLIIVFSTVTTTFLDVYSAGVSSESVSSKFKEKPFALIVCVVGTFLAIFTPITQYENFLLLISSVFAPMIAILVSDYFIIKKDCSHEAFNFINIGIWVIGFVLYRYFMKMETPIGYTFPVMIITSLICIFTNKILGGKKNA